MRAFEALLRERGLTLRSAAELAGTDYYLFRRLAQGRFATLPAFDEMRAVTEPLGISPYDLLPVHVAALLRRAGLPGNVGVVVDGLVRTAKREFLRTEMAAEGQDSDDLARRVRHHFPHYLDDWSDEEVHDVAEVAAELVARLDHRPRWQRDLVQYGWLVELAGARSGFEPSPLSRSAYNDLHWRHRVYLVDDNPGATLAQRLRAERMAVHTTTPEWTRMTAEGHGTGEDVVLEAVADAIYHEFRRDREYDAEIVTRLVAFHLGRPTGKEGAGP